ncbi:MAG: aminotransferase class V-fold PLP-dependent enzyme [Rhodospirillaceae bacterium]|nr:aminotransferase class V-fold PLP-dependent enzyme [Rhodospirillaceae bacterium]MBT7614522.1 aminotransferase class V-fold PLP-dependent enzyme [Rhodospirillaceae bacterium]MBT7647381.1 aminotransferase class V-fold PLP-dependent enzyme [Rhodospirillaceae bacterium]
MADKPLDLDFVRSFFPALNDGWAFMENAGGSLVPHTVIDRVKDYMTECQVQPGDNSVMARDAQARMKQGQETVAAMINAEPEEVVIGPSTTRNVITLAAAVRGWFKEGDELIVTNLDHEANNGHWRRLEEFGITVREWQVNPETAELELETLAAMLSDKTRLVCFSHCSNITGGPNPVAEIAAMVHEVGGLVCVDGVAYAPHGSVDVKALNVDFYLFSLYKTYGPHLGVMHGKKDLLLEAKGQYFFFHGEDDLPAKMNPGAPNHELTAGCVGIGDYFEALAAHHLEEPANDLHGRMRQMFGIMAVHEENLSAKFLAFAANHPKIRLIGRATPEHDMRAPTFSFTIEGVKSQDVPALLEAKGLAANAGDFYAPRVLKAVGIDPDDGAIRCSFVHYNTLDEVDRLIAALTEIAG